MVEQDVVLPRANMDFKISDIIGRCNSYCACNDTIALVCGGDGQTYQDSCFARCAGVEVSFILTNPPILCVYVFIIQILDATGPCTMTYGELFAANS